MNKENSMNKRTLFALALCFGIFVSQTAFAHFGMVIPSKSTVMESKESALTLSLKFWHPFENKGMNLEKPTNFQVFVNGKSENRVWYKIDKTGLNLYTNGTVVDSPNSRTIYILQDGVALEEFRAICKVAYRT